jgi:hypothetical protein
MAKQSAPSEHAYAILVDSRVPGTLPFKWSIIDSRTREVVEASGAGHRTMEAAFTAAGPARSREGRLVPITYPEVLDAAPVPGTSSSGG